jgi:hypothetical protein
MLMLMLAIALEEILNHGLRSRQIISDVPRERTCPFGDKAVTIYPQADLRRFADSPIQLSPVRVIRVIRGCGSL